MKFHTPFFIVGFVLIALPLLGLPQAYQDISTITFGIGLMLLAASANFSKARNKIDMMSVEGGSADDSAEKENVEVTDEVTEEVESPTYSEMTEMIAELEEETTAESDVDAGDEEIKSV